MYSKDTRLIGDLAASIAAGNVEKRVKEFSKLELDYTPHGPFWDCVLQSAINEALADWEQDFFKATSATSVSRRYPFRLATAGGELLWLNPNGGSGYSAKFGKLTVYALQNQTIDGSMSFVGSGSRVQMKVNGLVTETVGPGDFDISIYLAKGHNTISFAVDDETDSFQFNGRLFDSQTVFWVDPLRPRIPSRESTSVGSGGIGGQSGHPGGSESGGLFVP